MKKNISKTKAKEEIETFFMKIKSKGPKEVKKMKILAMGKNIPLKGKRKLFCKKCFVPYENPKIRIKNKIKTVVCQNCESISRWKL